MKTHSVSYLYNAFKTTQNYSSIFKYENAKSSTVVMILAETIRENIDLLSTTELIKNYASFKCYVTKVNL